jgi:hypothetical protein
MRISEKEYLLSAIVAVTGFSPSTFNSMRQRNGFLGEREEKGRWARYSLVDICTAQVARDLVGKGISTQLAVDVANKLTARFACLEKEDTALEFYDNHIAVVTGPLRDSISLSFHNSTEAPLSSAVIAVIDLYAVFMRVLDALKELGAERVIDARRVVFGAFAKVFEDRIAADAENDLSSGSGELTGGAERTSGNTIRGTLPARLRKNNLRRIEASEYLESVYGIRYATATLAKMASMGTGPDYYKQGRSPLYPRDALDTWARKRLGSLHSSSSDHAHGSASAGD